MNSENINNILIENNVDDKEVSGLWGTNLQATRAKLKGAQNISLNEALILGDYLFVEANELVRFLRMLRDLNKSTKKVRKMLLSACEKQCVDYKELPKLLGLNTLQFSQRVTMKTKFSTAEILILAQAFYDNEGDQYNFIKKMSEIYQ